VADFVKYVTKHQEAGCTVYVDADSMSATVVLESGIARASGHCDKSEGQVAEAGALQRHSDAVCWRRDFQRLFAQWVEERNKVTTALDTEQKELHADQCGDIFAA
jgi:uncharacterized protein YfdQ (DUF2303 family)